MSAVYQTVEYMLIKMTETDQKIDEIKTGQSLLREDTDHLQENVWDLQTAVANLQQTVWDIEKNTEDLPVRVRALEMSVTKLHARLA